MKKTKTLNAAIAIMIGTSALAQSNLEIQQKTNYILMKKVEFLEKRVKSLEVMALKNKLDIEKTKNAISPDILPYSQQKHVNQAVQEKTTGNNENFFKLNRRCLGYKNKNNKKSNKRVLKKGTYVKIIKHGPLQSMIQNKLWVDNSCFKKVEKKELDKGTLYKIKTYMANARTLPGIENDITSVYRKDDVIFTTSEEKSKNGGVWCKIKNDGYINKRIIKQISRQ